MSKFTGASQFVGFCEKAAAGAQHESDVHGTLCDSHEKIAASHEGSDASNAAELAEHNSTVARCHKMLSEHHQSQANSLNELAETLASSADDEDEKLMRAEGSDYWREQLIPTTARGVLPNAPHRGTAVPRSGAPVHKAYEAELDDSGKVSTEGVPESLRDMLEVPEQQEV